MTSEGEDISELTRESWEVSYAFQNLIFQYNFHEKTNYIQFERQNHFERVKKNNDMNTIDR